MSVLSDATEESATKSKAPRGPSDPYGALAVMAENKMPISPTTQWDLQQRRQWPPPLYHAYCTTHFIQECLIYYSLARERLEVEENCPKKSMTVHQNVKETPAMPTRVQPSRKAKGGTGATTHGVVGQAGRGQKAAGTNTETREPIPGLKTQLQLHLPWSTFRAHLEAIIGAEPQGKELQDINNMEGKANESKSKDNWGKYLFHESCPFQGSWIHLDCRYCHHKPPTPPADGKSPEHRAPMAPMYSVRLGYILDQPVHDFGELRFAVDACGEEKFIVLIGLETRKRKAEFEELLAALKGDKDQPSKRRKGAKK